MSNSYSTTPLLSIVVPVYNGYPYIRECVESILNQTFNNFILIIIDDGSIDLTAEYLSTLKDERIQIINNKINIGIIKSFNYALDQINTEFTARVDADDICEKTKFEKQIKFMLNEKEVVLSGTWAEHISENSQRKGFGVKLPVNHNEIVKSLFEKRSAVVQPSAIIRTAALKKLGGYRDNVFPEDYDLYYRLLEHGKLANIPEVLYAIRLHKNSYTFKNMVSLQYSNEQLRLHYAKKYLKYKVRYLNEIELLMDTYSIVYYRKGISEYLNGSLVLSVYYLLFSSILNPLRLRDYIYRKFLS